MIVLRDYQEELAARAADLLLVHGLAILIMEVRTGKTLTALHTCHLRGYSEVLFVTKKKAISSIENDFEKSGYRYNLTVTNYEQLNKLEPKYSCIIYDEFHCLGAFPIPSERTKECKKLSVGAHVIMLSGTPTPESWSQLYHPLWASGRGPWTAYPNFYKWAKDYVILKHKYVYNRQINDYSSAKIESIKKDVEPYVIRFSQEQAGFSQVVEDKLYTVPMPAKVETSLHILKRDKIFTTSSARRCFNNSLTLPFVLLS